MYTVATPSQILQYEVKASARARRVGIRVRPGGHIVVTTPMRVSELHAHAFVRKSLPWLEKIFKRQSRRPIRTPLPRGKKDYLEHKAAALARIKSRVMHFNEHYGFTFGRISVKNQSSRWGSCSRKGNLNFSYKLIHLPHDVADYVVVHELCHLAEFNHSKRFWARVAETMPQYKALRTALHAFDLR